MNAKVIGERLAAVAKLKMEIRLAVRSLSSLNAKRPL